MIRKRPKPAGSTIPDLTCNYNGASTPLTASIVAGFMIIGSAAGASTTPTHAHIKSVKVAQSTAPSTSGTGTTAGPATPSAATPSTPAPSSPASTGVPAGSEPAAPAPVTPIVPPPAPGSVPSTPGMPAVPGSAQPGASELPAGPIPTPPVTTIAPGVPPVTMTIDQAVTIALNNNSSIALARERLYKAKEQIRQGVAEALPQISAAVTDVYSSQKSFSASAGGEGTPFSLPGGGVIPTVVDQPGASGTFVAGGGGGNVTAPGEPSSTGVSTPTGGGTSPVSGTSTGAPTGTSSPGTTGAPAGTSSPGTTGAPAGTGGTSGTGSGQAAPAPGSMLVASAFEPVASSFAPAALPADLTEYAAAQQATPSKAVAAQTPQPRQSGDGSGSGNGNNNNTVGEFNSGNHNNYAARISLDQAVDIFGIVPASLDVLRRTRDFYQTDLDRVSNELALTVKNDYFTVLRDEANVAADQEQVRSAAENVRITTATYNAGQAARFDVLTAQTTLANDNQTLIAAQNQLAVDQATLNSLIGVSLDQPVTLVTPPLPPLDQPIDLNAAVNTAFTHRPELIQAENNIVIAKRLVRLTGAAMLPSLSLDASASYNGPATEGVPNSDYTISANLNWPIYDGGSTASKVRSAQSDVRTQVITRDQLRLNVTLEVRQAYLDSMSARSAVGAAQVGVDQAADAARLAEVRFRTGVGTFLDVINAQAQLATARTNLATAEFQYQTSLASLTRAEGGR